MTYIIFSWLKPTKQNNTKGKQKIIKRKIFKYKELKIKLIIQKINRHHKRIIIAVEYSIKPQILLDIE